MSKALNAVCNHYGITPSEIFNSKTRKKNPVIYRQMLICVIRNTEKDITLNDIREYFKWNGFIYNSHVSISKSVESIERKMINDLVLKNDYNLILDLMNNSIENNCFIVIKVDLSNGILR